MHELSNMPSQASKYFIDTRFIKMSLIAVEIIH